MPRAGNNAVSATGMGLPTSAMTAIEADGMGNVLVGGTSGNIFAYNKAKDTWYPYAPGTYWNMRSITFNTADSRYYIAAYDTVGAKAGIFYTDIAPLVAGDSIYAYYNYSTAVANETVITGALGGETTFSLANTPVIDATVYKDNAGTWTMLIEITDYTLDLPTGIITMNAPLVAGDSIYVYYNYSTAVANETVIFEATGGETELPALANIPLIDATVYMDHAGIWTMLVVSTDYTLDLPTGIITMTTPLDGGSNVYFGTLPISIPNLRSIDWNPALNYGLAVGDGVYKIKGLSGSFETTVIQPPTIGYTFYDVAWDTDGWNEAAIVGQNITLARGVYWRYYDTNPMLIEGWVDAASPSSYLCGSIKPPSSPKIVFIPTGTGGIVANIETSDESTRITANAVMPKLWWIGFNDTLLGSQMDTQVDVDADHIFSFQYNYTLGWDLCAFEIQAWYDNGVDGTGGSAYPAVPDDSTRNLAFTILCDSTGATSVFYPAPDLEVTTAPATPVLHWANPVDLSGAQDHYRFYIPVWFGNQLRMADYGGVGANGPDYSSNPTVALNDVDSWDFSVRVFDTTSGGFNISYGEFGIKETISIAVTGNPTGNAPPGSNDNVMGPVSTIVYSANNDYYVDVEIPDLHMNGDILIANPIPATSVSVQNLHTNATGNSDIAARTFFIGPAAPLLVWGTVGVPIAPDGNGTISAGPLETNFNSGTVYTELEWLVNVPGATAEGVYWGTIHITIYT
ncbi:MAG: hypothetical protein KKH41_09025 [Candidatus Thermoplasmatota archaeon]|nr:hypothetical protein [Euryarchaeota archaeon]MBU4032816.1 hypothetical protein [Candidatus Thermoplasmatota archaeon]MBU4071541.1 hypothetical protein [Candidatus Thermoplasmatota archaeon]MBU4144499.1 hypothetical protein [Candidatus Thermoplasmatota archaeon]MBU4592707.1 hypothetical protein [Candidatus Thermoplasmatota archaeon]